MKRENKGLMWLCSTSKAGLKQYILRRRYFVFCSWEGWARLRYSGNSNLSPARVLEMEGNMTRALSFCHFFPEDTVLSFATWQVGKQKMVTRWIWLRRSLGNERSAGLSSQCAASQQDKWWRYLALGNPTLTVFHYHSITARMQMP